MSELRLRGSYRPLEPMDGIFKGNDRLPLKGSMGFPQKGLGVM